MLLKLISVCLELGPKCDPCQPFCAVLLVMTASGHYLTHLLAKHTADCSASTLRQLSCRAEGLVSLLPLGVCGELAFFT